MLDIGCGTGANTFDAVEKAKLVFGEKLQNAGKPQRSFEEMFQLACDFLSGLWDIWKNGD